MAKMHHNFMNFAAQTLEVFSGTNGTPSISSAQAQNGSYSCLLDDSADSVQVSHRHSGESDQSLYKFCEFWIYFTDVTPATLSNFFRNASTVVANADFSLELETDGDLAWRDGNNTVQATVTAPFTDNQWHRIRWNYLENATTGVFKLWIDESLVINLTGQDTQGSDSYSNFNFYGLASSEDYYIDAIYYGSGGAGDLSDFLQNPTFLGPFNNTAEDATDQGSTLDSGQWSDASEVPLSDTNFARYTTANAGGHTRTDEGTRVGPGTFSGIVCSAKWMNRGRKPSTVAATVHEYRMGKFSGSDTYTTAVRSLTEAWDTHIYIYDPNTRNWTPESGDYFVGGMQIDNGGEGFDLGEHNMFLLVDDYSPEVTNMVGFEVGGYQECDGSTGTPAVTSGHGHGGYYGLQIDATGEGVEILWDHLGGALLSDGGFILSFYAKLHNKSTSADTEFISIRDDFSGTPTVLAGLEFAQTDADLRVRDNAGAQHGTDYSGIVADKWHRYDLYINNLGSATAGVIILYVDGSEIVNTSTADLATTQNNFRDAGEGHVRIQFSAALGTTVSYDDVVCTQGCDAITDRINYHSIEPFCNDLTGSQHQGSALDAGTWANTGERPLSTTNFATYSTGGASGGCWHSVGSRVGPAWMPVLAGKFFAYARKPSAVAATVHRLRMGKIPDSGYDEVDKVIEQVILPTTSWASYQYVWMAGIEHLPDGREFAHQGMSIDSGGESFDIAEQYYMGLVDASIFPCVINHCGFETGGLEEPKLVNNTPTIITSPVRSGSYASEHDSGSNDRVEFGYEVNDKCIPNASMLITFFVRFTSGFAGGTDSSFMRAYDGTPTCRFDLNASETVDFYLDGQIGTSQDLVTADTWHRVDVLLTQYNLTHASTMVYWDGAEVTNWTTTRTRDWYKSGQMLDSNEQWNHVRFVASAAGAFQVRFDDLVVMLGDENMTMADRLSDFEIRNYQNTAEDATDQGSTLDSGTWANAGEVPVNDTNYARYTTAGAIGFARFDEGSRLGPNRNLEAIKYLWRMRKPSTVAQTDKWLRYGKYDGVSTDTYHDRGVQPGTAWEIRQIQGNLTAGVAPMAAGEYAIMGHGVAATGGEGMDIGDMFALALFLVEAKWSDGVGRGVLEGVGRGVG